MTKNYLKKDREERMDIQKRMEEELQTLRVCILCIKLICGIIGCCFCGLFQGDLNEIVSWSVPLRHPLKLY